MDMKWIILAGLLTAVFVHGHSIFGAAEKADGKHEIKLTVLYDNYQVDPRTQNEWGFACLVEGMERTVLFDCGGKPDVLKHNMNSLGIDSSKIDDIVISHNHWDHIGGISYLINQKQKFRLYLPSSVQQHKLSYFRASGSEVLSGTNAHRICKRIHLAGEIGDRIKEQALIIDSRRGLVVITGCSHPGIIEMVRQAKEYLNKEVYMVLGGFHLMRHSDDQVKAIIRSLKELGIQKCGATHCTGDRQIRLFSEAFGKDYIKIGSGKIILI